MHPTLTFEPLFFALFDFLVSGILGGDDDNDNDDDDDDNDDDDDV